MNLAQRLIAKALGGIIAPSGTVLNGRVTYPNKAGYLGNVAEGYNKNAIVASCVGLYISTLNEPPLIVRNDNGSLNYSHPLSLQFRRPNKHMGQAEFWQIVWLYISISGNCYIRKVKGGAGNVVEIYPYSDAFVAPKLDANGWVYAYTFVSGNVVQEWPASEVIHVVNPLYRDPLKPYMGISPIEIAWDKILTYNELSATVYSLAASNAVVSGILSAPGDVPAGDVLSLKAQLQKRKTSKGKERTEPLVLGNGMTYSAMGLDMQKLQAKELFIELGSEICSAFRVHPSILGGVAGLSVSTYNNLETAFTEFTRLVRLPFWNAIEEQIEAGFKQEYGNDIQLEFDTKNVAALAADPDSLIYPVLAQFNANTITQNEARQKMGYEHIEEGDKFAYEVVPPTPSFGAFAADTEAVENVTTDIEGTKTIKWVESEAYKYWKSNDDVLIRAANEIQIYVAAMFEEMQKQVIATEGKGYKKYSADIDIETLLEQFLSASKKTRDFLLQNILDLATRAVGSDLTSVQSFIDDIKDKTTRQVTDRMRESLEVAKKDVAAVLEANTGKTLAEITKALKDKFKTLSEGRAATIAQTTTKAQASATQEEAWQGLNERETNPKRKIYKAWLTQRDSRVRDSHEKLDGKVIEVSSGFAQGLQAPGLGTDPSNVINCRCTLRPVRAGKIL